MKELLTHPGTYILVIAIGTIIWKIARWVERISSDNEKFNEFMRNTAGDIQNIKTNIAKIFGKLSPASIAEGSPLQLTELGERISQTLGAREWARDTALTLDEKIKELSPYDIQEFCFDYAKNVLVPSNQLESKIKMCAYENAIERDAVLDVLAVELRNQLLSN